MVPCWYQWLQERTWQHIRRTRGTASGVFQKLSSHGVNSSNFLPWTSCLGGYSCLGFGAVTHQVFSILGVKFGQNFYDGMSWELWEKKCCPPFLEDNLVRALWPLKSASIQQHCDPSPACFSDNRSCSNDWCESLSTSRHIARVHTASHLPAPMLPAACHLPAPSKSTLQATYQPHLESMLHATYQPHPNPHCKPLTSPIPSPCAASHLPAPSQVHVLQATYQPHWKSKLIRLMLELNLNNVQNGFYTLWLKAISVKLSPVTISTVYSVGRTCSCPSLSSHVQKKRLPMRTGQKHRRVVSSSFLCTSYMCGLGKVWCLTAVVTSDYSADRNSCSLLYYAHTHFSTLSNVSSIIFLTFSMSFLVYTL